MDVQKILLFLTFLILGPPCVAFTGRSQVGLDDDRYFTTNKILEEFYNNYDSVEKNIQAREAVWKLLQDFGNDPYFYDLWAFIELVTISHELEIKIDEQKDISRSAEYLERIRNYHQVIDRGFALTDSKRDSKSLLLRASLLFDKARFTAKFEGGLSGLRRADKDSADGIKIAIKILSKEKEFCLGYHFLGITSFGLAAKTEPWSLDRLVVRAGSWTYDALHVFNKDVFNKARSLEILESIYNCKGLDVWAEKFWLESSFFLAGAYQNFRKDLKITDELKLLEEKELPLLRRLTSLFPSNQDVARKLKLADLRTKILRNYFESKKWPK